MNATEQGRWTVWLKEPRSEKIAPRGYGARLQLVHWTGEGNDPETECRVIDVRIDNEGTVIVEHSSANGGPSPNVENITRVALPGWSQSEGEWGEQDEH